MELSFTSTVVFIAYFVGIVLLGLWVARHKTETSEQYFLAGRSVPWYAVGLSYIGSNISTEHFIGMVGAAYIYGIAPANWEWFTVIGFLVLVWVFLPYYYRSKMYTIPEFLERRFDHRTRAAFASLLIFQGVFIVLAGALYAGGMILNNLFFKNMEFFVGHPDWGLFLGIVIIAVSTGAYCIYGGLLSVIWTDVVQVVVMFTGAIIISVMALKETGGFSEMLRINEAIDAARVHLVQPATHDFAPWTGMFSFWFTVCLWAVCTKQYYVQRCLAARTEWDARMGVIFAGFLKIILPFLVVFPGMMALVIYGEGLERDTIYLKLIMDFMPASLLGLMLAAMASAVMSTVSSVLNSSSTMFSLDIYKRYCKKNPTEHNMVAIGRWTTTIFIIVATLWAPFIKLFGRGLFIYIQDMSSYVAAPIAVIFTLGILWKKSTANAATVTLIFGILFGVVIKVFCLYHANQPQQADYVIWLSSFLNRTLVNWSACMAVMIILSFCTKPPSAKNLRDGIIWKPKYSRLPVEERQSIPFYKSLGFWTVIMLIGFIIVYCRFI